MTASLRTYLARLEEQLDSLTLQWRRAEERVALWSSNAPSPEDEERDQGLFKAEQFANRLHQQRTRLIKDIQKAHQDLAVPVYIPPERLQTAPPAPQTPLAEASTLPAPTAAESPASPPTLPAATPPSISAPSAPTSAAKRSTAPLTAPNSRELPPELNTLSPPATGEEIDACMRSHRDYLKIVDADKRASAILRLIQERRDRLASAKPKNAA